METVFVMRSPQFYFELSDYCIKEIEKKMGDKPVADWRSADYTTLSSRLGKQTKIYLSENTLRRVLGKLQTSKKYNPQKATRDALAQFIGYRDWEELGLIHQLSKKEVNISSTDVSPTQSLFSFPVAQPVKVKKRLMANLLFGALMMLFILLGGSMIWQSIAEPPLVKLICDNPFGNVPHSAVFKLNFKATSANDKEYEIDFLEEATRSSISGDRSVTKFFKNPGVVYATLFYKGKSLDTTSIYMQTKGWVANSGNDTSRAYPVTGLRALDPKNIYVSAEQLDSAGLDTKSPFLIGFSNVKPSKINGDNFSFSCKIFSEKNRPGTQCVGTALLILGEKDKHVINLFRKNCAVFCDYKFSELRVLGTEEYLGALAFDPEKGGNVNIKVKNKQASVYINGKHVLRTSYKNSIGKVMGIKIVFNGIGRVISPKLVDLSTGEVY